MIIIRGIGNKLGRSEHVMDIVLPLALLLNYAGMHMLFVSWRGRSTLAPTFLTFTAWAVLIISLALWCRSIGWEFGSVYWSIVTALLAFCLIYLNRETKPVRTKVQPYASSKLNQQRIWPALFSMFVAGPMAFLAASAFSLSLFKWASLDANTLVFATFLFFLLWAVMAYWVAAAEKVRTPALWFAGIALLGNTVLFGI